MPTDDLMGIAIDVSCLSHQLINLEGAKSSTRYPFTRHYHNSVIISLPPNRRWSSATEASNLNQYMRNRPSISISSSFFWFASSSSWREEEQWTSSCRSSARAGYKFDMFTCRVSGFPYTEHQIKFCGFFFAGTVRCSPRSSTRLCKSK